MKFKILAKDGNARVGKLTVNGKEILTPSFGFVATKGLLRASIPELFVPDYGIINTYHFFLNDNYKIIEELNLKSVHEFVNMKKSILLTDSGGFQVFSLGFGFGNESSKMQSKEFNLKSNFVTIKEEGVYFKDPVTNHKYFLSPEISMEIQSTLGAEFVVAFDECTHPLHSKEYTSKAVERTTRWLIRSAERFEEVKKSYQVLLPVNQGGKYLDLRIKSAKDIVELSKTYDFNAFAIGGAFGNSYGDSKENLKRVIETVHPILNEEKESPIHLLGIGMIDDILNSVERGIDLFDCITPTKLARHGYLFVSPESDDKKSKKARIKISRGIYKYDNSPIDPWCNCFVCQNYTKSFLWHQYKNNILSYFILATHHNLSFMDKFFKEMRAAIKNEEFKEFKEKWLLHYNKI